MTEELLAEFRDKIDYLKLVPSIAGRYEVSVDGELIFSKVQTGRHAEVREIKDKIWAKLRAR